MYCCQICDYYFEISKEHMVFLETCRFKSDPVFSTIQCPHCLNLHVIGAEKDWVKMKSGKLNPCITIFGRDYNELEDSKLPKFEATLIRDDQIYG